MIAKKHTLCIIDAINIYLYTGVHYIELERMKFHYNAHINNNNNYPTMDGCLP